MSFVWATVTHPGLVRPNNQDTAHPEASGRSDGPVVLMVADGMGGHVAGEVASRVAVDAALERTGSTVERLSAGNEAVLANARENPELAGMGTTMTLVELKDGNVAEFAHVGDSRAYLSREGELRQLTTDHTVVAEYVASGALSPEEAAVHPQRSALTRAVGLGDELEVDSFQERLEPGDRLLLCSDGVNAMITDDDIGQALGAGSAEEAAWDLVERANRAGGYDNITVVVVDVL